MDVILGGGLRVATRPKADNGHLRDMMVALACAISSLFAHAAAAAPCCLGLNCVDQPAAACAASGGIPGHCLIGLGCSAATCDAASIGPIRTVKAVKSLDRLSVELVWDADPNASEYDLAYVTDKRDLPVPGNYIPVTGMSPTTIPAAIDVNAVAGPGGSIRHYQVSGDCQVVDAGWQIVTMRPGVFLYDMQRLGDIGYAAGGMTVLGTRQSLSTFLKTTDRGVSWVERQLPDLTVTSINGLSFVSTDLGWVVGDSGRIFKTTDGAQTWREQFPGTNRDLRQVSFISADEGWVCGDGSGNYLLLHTVDGGQSWSNLSFGSGGIGVQDCQFLDAMHGWMAVRDTTAAPHLLRTLDGGQSWIEATSVPAAMSGIQDIEMVDLNTGFAVGYSNPAGTIIKTTDGGDTWFITGVTGNYYNDAIDCALPTQCAIASFDLAQRRARLYVTDDAGMSWVNRPIPLAHVYMLSIAYANKEVWIGSDDSAIFRSTDDGVNFQWAYHAPLWYTMTWRDQATGWASTGSHFHTDGYTEKSVDGGQTWSYDLTPPGGSTLTYVDSAAGFSCSHGNNPPVRRTVNGGGNWATVSTLSGAWHEGCAFLTATRSWAYGSNGLIRRSDDAGLSWSAPLATQTTQLVTWVQFVDPDTGWACGGAGGTGFIIHSTDAGNTWTHQAPAPDHFRVGHFLDANIGFIGTAPPTVYRTMDGGQNFTLVASFPQYDIAAVYVHSPTHIWVAAHDNISENGRGHIYKSEDGGDNWSEEWVSPWIDNPILDLVPSPDRRTLWAVGENALIIQRSLP